MPDAVTSALADSFHFSATDTATLSAWIASSTVRDKMWTKQLLISCNLLLSPFSFPSKVPRFLQTFDTFKLSCQPSGDGKCLPRAADGGQQ